MGDAAGSQISEAMNRLWQKFLPQMEERVATLQNAAGHLSTGASISREEQSSAAAEAHKLAGVLGTFGLQEGTELAREAEGLLEGSSSFEPTAVARLNDIAERLKVMIASRG
ncbi:Hpt domain-containing protein [Occallatibacter savannae]|uniref:Hpt domain-containing protein n=1 Tax=Occallatibacter savannae TaxID=1002691 RepID=UPI000D69571C|nr:Hpt domain-containing protein [Occallatibacter savannae]